MAIDNTTLQIFANYCSAAAESMAYTLVRTAHSTFVKETEDFSCSMITPDGQTFASPKTLSPRRYLYHQRSLQWLCCHPLAGHRHVEAGVP
jgi:N-methylhydantoinase B